MKLTNEPLLIRTFIGATLALLVAFGVRLSGTQIDAIVAFGVRLSGAQMDAIVAFADITITLAGALIGALSSHGKVDGPVTAQNKTDEIERLRELLNDSVAFEGSPPSKRPPPVTVLLALVVGCSGVQVKQDAACSPEADVWFARELATVCEGRTLRDCPESDSIGDEYETRAEAECSKQ